MNSVNKSSGEVDPSKLDILKVWKSESTIENVLLALLNEMSADRNKKLTQPKEGTTF